MLRYLEIKYQLEEMIASMEPQDPLPSREALCKLLDTTHATLQKAIHELIKDGKLETITGSGTFIAGPKTQPAEIRNIGVIIPNNEEDCYRDFIRGLNNFLETENANMILSLSGGEFEKQNQLLTRLLSSKVSGIIIVPAYSMDLTKDYVLYNRLEQHNMPVVFGMRGISGLNTTPTVCYNNFYAGYTATNHLIKMGYRHIAYMERYLMRTGLDRYQGYVAAMIENGLEINRNAIRFAFAEDEHPHGYTEFRRILDDCPEVDAIFCQADELIAGVYQAIREKGLRVSDDIGVIGFDDIKDYVMLDPPATTLGGHYGDIGYKAAKILWQIVNHADNVSPLYVMQPKLIQRQSCLGPKKTG